MENTEGMVTGGNSTSKAMGEVKESSWFRQLKRENLTLKKLPATDDKMTPDSPTCAIDADELIMRGKMELDMAENDAGDEKKARKGSLHSDKLVGYSIKTPLTSSVVGHSNKTSSVVVGPGTALKPPALGHNYLLRPRESLKASFTGEKKSSSRATKDKMLFATVAQSLPRAPPQAAQASTPPDSEPAPSVAFAPAIVPSCTTALNDSKFLLLVELDNAGKTAGSIESGNGPTKSGRMDDNLLSVKVAPPAAAKRAPAPTPARVLAPTLKAYTPAPANVPAPASALTAYTPAPASGRAVAGALAPPLAG